MHTHTLTHYSTLSNTYTHVPNLHRVNVCICNNNVLYIVLIAICWEHVLYYHYTVQL